MLDEMQDDYVRAVKTAMVDYDLRSTDIRHHQGLVLDMVDRIRYVAPPLASAESLGIHHDDVAFAGQAIARQLHTTEPCLARLWQLWWGADGESYDDLRLTTVNALPFRAMLPLSPDDFAAQVDQQCERAIGVLRSQWHKDAAEVIANFVIELEEPQKKQRDASDLATSRQGVRAPDPADNDFHRFFKSLTRLGSTYQPPPVKSATQGHGSGAGAAGAGSLSGTRPHTAGASFGGAGGEAGGDDMTELLHGVFRAAAVLMSIRLRDVVYASVADFMRFLNLYADADAERSRPESDCVPAFMLALRVEREPGALVADPVLTERAQAAADAAHEARAAADSLRAELKEQEAEDADSQDGGAGAGAGGEDEEGKGVEADPNSLRSRTVRAEEAAEAAEKVAAEAAAAAAAAVTQAERVSFGFAPGFEELEERLMGTVGTLVRSCSSFARVEQAIAVSGSSKPGDAPAMTPTSVLSSVTEDDETIEAARARVAEVVAANRVGPEALVHRFDQFAYLFSEAELVKVKRAVGEEHTLAEYAEMIANYNAVKDAVDATCGDLEVFSMVAVHTVVFKADIRKQAQALASMIIGKVLADLVATCAALNARYQQISAILQRRPETSEDLVQLNQFWGDVTVELKEMEARFHGKDGVKDHCLFLYQHHQPLSKEDAVLFKATFQWPGRIQEDQEQCASVLNIEKDKMVQKLEWRTGLFEKEIKSWRLGVENLHKEAGLTPNRVADLIKRIGALRSNLEEGREEVARINEQQRLLEQEETDHAAQIEVVMKALEPFEQLWTTVGEYLAFHRAWYEAPLKTADPEKAERDADTVKVSMIKMCKRLDPDTTGEPRRVAQQVRDECMKFLRQDHPLLVLLANPGIKERHWEQMEGAVGYSLPHNDASSLNDMIELKLNKKVEAIEEVCVNASKEYSLEKALERMRGEWAPVELELKTWKDTGTSILTGTSVDEVQALLDDHIVKAQTMMASRYAKPLIGDIKAWVDALQEIQAVLDVWLKVQATWLYLEPIFGSADIMKQMPAEGKKFQIVDSTWRGAISGAKQNPKAVKAMRQEGLLAKMQDAHKLLDEIQKGLNAYLETKRLYFPRFFFLSNDELLEILSETKDPQRVQPHLKKCFEGIAKLEFGEAGEILKMFSSDGEMVELSPKPDGSYINPADANGCVEVWLVEVEATMRRTVARFMDDCTRAYPTSERVDWAREWPGQAVLGVSQVYWTQQIEGNLAESGNAGLAVVHEKLVGQLNDIIMLVRGKLQKKERVTLGALVVLDVHARDVTLNMKNNGVDLKTHFDWVAQLRYYWKDDGKSALTGVPGSLTLKMINAQTFYSGEYLGNSGRLVITPLTDRCYRTLMGAIHLNLGGAPEGPAGTGKTETVKDLAKAAGMMCVVFNCSDGLDYLAMAKFFKGLAASGAWACFDEFNRIQLEVLSVVAQQILTIQRAKLSTNETFVFEGSTIKIDRTANVFITMNPGYAGRAELPDNLKALFRTVAMMVPDYALIAEIILYSFGYMGARSMARKIVATYKLCSEQLSSQDHYDYGMRAVMTVLRAAGNLKRDETLQALPEDVLVLQAVVDANLPKFLSHDVPLFNGIVQDLFPGVQRQPPDRSQLVNCMKAACFATNLQPDPLFLEKVLQIYEMMIVRHGFMVVGFPFGGKTCAIHNLQQAIAMMHEKLPEDPTWAPINHVRMNPKSITMGQLYGCFDDVTHEWTDGVLAHKFRQCATGKVGGKGERIWVLFDGPVDAIWIENMNTVLDDNKKLCLMSGEIVAMGNNMNMVFETMDLAVASPATVSRCGMIFMEPHTCGWRPMVQSWLDVHMEDNPDYAFRPARPSKAPKKSAEEAAGEKDVPDPRPFTIDAEMRAQLDDLFEWMVDPLLTVVRKRLKEYSPTMDHFLVNSLCKVFQAMMGRLLSTGADGFPVGKASFVGRAEPTTGDVECLFVFALVWSIGGSTDGPGRAIFSDFLRGLASGGADFVRTHDLLPFIKLRKWDLGKAEGRAVKLALPTAGCLHDYVYSPKEPRWRLWTDLLPDADIPRGAAYSSIIVPTVASAQFDYIVRTLVDFRITTCVCGPTGTGKSVYMNRLLFKTLDQDVYKAIGIGFSARTSAMRTQSQVDQRLDRRRKGVYGPRLGQTAVVFVDDLNLPELEFYGAQPPIELLRQLVDNGGWYDLTELEFRRMEDTLLVAAMGPPGGGRNLVTPRLMAKFALVCFPESDNATLQRIFGSIVDWFLSTHDFGHEVGSMSKSLVAATLDVFNTAVAGLRPTPTKSHYTFNLRDFSRVVEGVLLSTPDTVMDKPQMVRLWLHEALRVFFDRLVTQEDRHWFLERARDMTKKHFGQDFNELLAHLNADGTGVVSDEDVRGMFFADYIDPNASTRLYKELPELPNVVAVLNEYLVDYNMQHKTQMDLVMFLFFVEHVSRISRVLKMPRGHCLLVGVGGSGRQCSTRLAAFMSECALTGIELSKTYGEMEWRDDLKRIIGMAGTSDRPVVFLFSDTQIKWEGMVEDLSNILNSGAVPNLYAADEKAELLDKIAPLAKAAGLGKDASVNDLFAFFLDRSRQNLHLSICLSPIGDAFRDRLRKFPSLINCCTIDWFTAWPSDALTAVARKSISSLKLDDELTSGLVGLCMHFHFSARTLAQDFLTEYRRQTYVTPTSYLELLTQFNKSLGQKRAAVEGARNRYLGGLEKLAFATQQVNIMQKELEELQPVLKQSQKETDALMVRIQEKLPGVEQTRAVVKKEADIANAEAEKVAASKKECEDDLAEALPALEEALQALNTLKPADITNVKSMSNPPAGVRLVMAAVCVMLEIKPDRVKDPEGGVKKVEDYWPPAKRMLGDMKFLDRLRKYDKDNIPVKVVNKMKKTYIDDPNFTPEKVANVSTAALGLCKWARAMIVYDRVAKIVAPKRIALAASEKQLAVTMAALAEKQGALKAVEDELGALQAQFDAANKKKEDLEHQVDMCEKKLVRATQLIGGLGGEQQRWKEAAETLRQQLVNVTGDVVIGCGFMAYLGAYTMDFRVKCVQEWCNKCVSLGVPCTGADGSDAAYELKDVLGDPITIRQWHIDGLPTDSFSVDNAIIATVARRWPLMIDPQGQANKWVRSMEKENQLQVVKLTDATFLRTLENAVQFGQPVLLENVGEELDPALEPILLQNVFKQGGVMSIRLGDATVEYSDQFRFYITTKLRNPHYLPEVSAKVSLLNFMITPAGLEDQLLGIVVGEERPDLQEEKNRLIVLSAENRRKLKELEDQILQVLSSSEGNILEDETAIQVLNSSKDLSNEIKEKQAVAEETEKQIDATRAGYKPVAFHTSTLFFCIAALASIDPMYQYSMEWFVTLYVNAIRKSEKSSDLDTRIENLNGYFTFSLYNNVCRSLFEKDKLLFSFLLTIRIMQGAGKIDDGEWYFLLTGGVAMDNPHANPAAAWLVEKQWGEVCRLSMLDAFQGLRESFTAQLAEWQALYDNDEPHRCAMPGRFHADLTGFQKLLVLRTIRPDKVILGVQDFVEAEMGRKFLDPPPFDLASCHADSSVTQPLVFVLSPGSDPMVRLLKFAEATKHKVDSISLGQGQGPFAEALIKKARKDGGWVVLQNCHLAVSWMPTLEKICEDLGQEDDHREFRLWCTSYPSKDFPVSVLQNGVKMTNEPPKGLRANLRKSYLMDPISDPTFFNGVQNDEKFRRLLFSLCFFHALVQERRQFGPLGWNIPYEFNDSDLRISVRQLHMFVDDPVYKDADGEIQIPYTTLQYLIGQCNYGGRVTDDKDRRCLTTILMRLFSQAALESDRELSQSGLWKTPPADANSWEGYVEFIDSLPPVPQPEVFVMHSNANITKDQNDTSLLFASIMLTQRASGGSGAKSRDEVITEVVTDVLGKIRAPYDLEAIAAKYPVDWAESMNTVLLQELARYNRLVEVVQESMRDLEKALKGLVLMSPQLEAVGTDLFFGRVPEMWKGRSYPSLKPLSGYVSNLVQRLAFMTKWVEEGPPPAFWVCGFFFTQAFLTGAMQNYARRYTIPIDDVAYDFQMLEGGHDRCVGVCLWVDVCPCAVFLFFVFCFCVFLSSCCVLTVRSVDVVIPSGTPPNQRMVCTSTACSWTAAGGTQGTPRSRRVFRSSCSRMRLSCG